ncbi:hypothetical protein ACRALDRAFT_1076895 [Sodiomyces alcalophilus JCM 7366]|uniref:uncharacterized protein n=1 Tax=Sodiomyces alcalophilus JCM 7366 TaxID=591952 RepID=UPI0039B41425
MAPHLYPWSISLAIASAVVAQDVPYITELDQYSLLAPCAQSALSTVDVMTSSCGDDASALQSCVCTDGTNSEAMATSIASGVSFNCGQTATEDMASADIVFQAYCNPAATFQLPTPTTNIVSEMITDMPEYSRLAQCVQGGLADAVVLMSPYCPEPASLHATCMCKDNNSRNVSRKINSDVMFSCDADEDVTSAQEFFSAYCDMVNGTTELPRPSSPPGDMSYHIGALDQYESLPPCAQSAVSVAFRPQTSWLCPQGPQAVASCICLRESKYSFVSTSVESEVRAQCSSTASEDVILSSAIAVLEFYCSAARGEVVATIESSSAETSPTAQSGASRTSSGSTEATGGDDNNDSDDDSADSGPNIGAIVGGAVGGVVFVLVIVSLVWCVRRKRKPMAAATSVVATAPATSAPNEPGPWGDKPELSGVGVSVPPSELHTETWTPMPHEVHGSQQLPPAELPGHYPVGYGQQGGVPAPRPAQS